MLMFTDLQYKKQSIVEVTNHTAGFGVLIPGGP